ncbi:MAG: integrase core domain-containing protein [Planctomycetota bacterium]|nr:integrase core domain-containing protein [Planctomycetota bacterium]
MSAELRRLIREMSVANRLWGAPRIQAELAKLGVEVALSTVQKYMVRRPATRPETGPSWRVFLRNHLRRTVAVDFMTVATANFRVIHVFVVLSLSRRKILHVNVTGHPTAAWTAQQVVEAFPWGDVPDYLQRDRDGIYGELFKQQVKALGIEELISAPRSPWQNGYVERVIGTIRRECLDHMIVFGENHLREVLKEYVSYYNTSRTHLSLDGDCPEHREPQTEGRVYAVPWLGGLHHTYRRKVG